MSIKSIPAAWQSNLGTGGQTDRDERVYIDFRGVDYPDVARDTRNYCDRGDCESASLPAVRGEIGISTGTSAARSAEQAHRGSYSIKHTGNGSENYVAFMDSASTTDLHGILPGETVEIVVWVYIPTVGGPTNASEITLNFFHYAGGWAETVVAASVKDRWEKLTQRVTLGDADTGLLIRTEIDAAATSGEYYYIDDVELYRYPTFALAREDNLIDRGNCDSATAPALLGATPAAVANGSFARNATVAHGGGYSYKHTITTGGSDSNAFLTASSSTNLGGVVAGEVLEFSCWIYAPSSGGCQVAEINIQAQEYDASASAWAALDYAIASGAQNTWINLSVTWTIPTDDVTGFRCYLQLDSPASSGEYYYVDDIVVKRHSVPGTHYLSGGYTEHLLTLPDTGTIQVKFKPNFAFDTGTTQGVFGWRLSGSQELICFFLPGDDKFYVQYEDGGVAEKYLISARYDNGASFRNINQWITMTLAFNLTTGNTAGSSLWMNKTADDTVWSGAIGSHASTNSLFQIGAIGDGTLIGDIDIAYARFFSGLVATDAQVQNDFKDVEHEEIYWSFDGHANGETRCHIMSEPLIAGMNFQKSVKNKASGSHSSNTFAASLLNLNGEFSDDQNAAFDPANRVYNGTLAQSYMQDKCRIRVEDWYSGDFDNVFVGRIHTGFARKSLNETISVANIGAFDAVKQINNFRAIEPTFWEDALIAGTTESNSLMHLVGRMATRARVRQYLADNSFEDPGTLTDAWTASGGTFSRQTANPLFGSSHARLVTGVATRIVDQEVLFTGDEKLSVGQTYTFYVWILCASAATGASNVIRLAEEDSSGEHDVSSTLYTLAGGEGYVKVEVSHTVTDSTSDRLRVKISADNGQTIDFDGAMLIHGDRALHWFEQSTVVQETGAASGSVSADLAEVQMYDTIGFDIDAVTITHPWKRIEEGDRALDHLKSLADSTAPLYMGMDENGTLRYRAVLADDYADRVPAQSFSDTEIHPNLSTSPTVEQANSLIGHGAKIRKEGHDRNIWYAAASASFERDSLGSLEEVVTHIAEHSSNTWPDPDEFGIFWARYNGNQPIKLEAPPDPPPPTVFEIIWEAIEIVFDVVFGEGGVVDWLWGNFTARYAEKQPDSKHGKKWSGQAD